MSTPGPLAAARSLIGAERLWLAPGSAEKVLIGVTVHDARISYGRPQLPIAPLSGRGSRWVDADLLHDLDD